MLAEYVADVMFGEKTPPAENAPSAAGREEARAPGTVWSKGFQHHPDVPFDDKLAFIGSMRHHVRYTLSFNRTGIHPARQEILPEPLKKTSFHRKIGVNRLNAFTLVFAAATRNGVPFEIPVSEDEGATTEEGGR